MILLDDEQLREHLDCKITESEDTLNGLLDAEIVFVKLAFTNALSSVSILAQVYYERKFHAKLVEVNLNVPKLRSLPFEILIIERYRHKESSFE